MKKFALILIFLVQAASIAAVQPSNNPLNETLEEKPGLEKQKLQFEKKGLFDQLFSAFTVISADQTVNPGDRADFKHDFQIKEKVPVDQASVIFQVYDCGDSDCRNPPQMPEDDLNGDGKIDECSVEGDVPEDKDDCINWQTFSVSSLQLYLYNGGNYETSITYQVPENEEPQHYTTQTYVYDNSDYSIASDIDKVGFDVADPTTSIGGETQTSDSDGDGVNDSNDECPGTFGNKANGCPEKTTENDFDDDNILNSNDKCPRTSGVRKQNGCPVEKPGIDNPLLLILGVSAILILLVGGTVIWLQ